MSEPQPDIPPQQPPPAPAPVDYAPPPRPPSPLRNFAPFITGAIGSFGIIFIPTFLAGAEGFEGDVPRWAWPAVLAAAALTALFAWRLKRHGNAPMSAGVLVGTGVGLLLAGMCFSGT